MQGKDRNYIKFVAEKLGLDGSYVPRTYIEQIQLEKLVNDVMVWILTHCLRFAYLYTNLLI